MDPREELQALRRMAELEAKAGVSAPNAAPANHSASRLDNLRSPQGQAMLKRELLASPPIAVARGIKDLVDTGAEGLAWMYDKATGADKPTLSSLVTGQKPGEAARVGAMNQAGKDEFAAATEGQFMPKFARFTGNMAGVGPLVKGAGAAIGTVAPRLGAAFGSGGMTTGAAPAVGRAAKAADIAIRTAGGGAAGYVGAGAVDKDMANEGGVIGAFLPGAVKVAGVAANLAGQAARGTVKHSLGLATGVGAEPVAQAFRAGRAGNREFLENMRGDVPIDDILGRAKQGLDAMRTTKSAQYRSGMIPVAGDKTALAFDDIERAFGDAASVTGYKGQVKNEAAAGYVSRMKQAVDEWRTLDPAEYHTPEGMDALKQKLGAIMEAIPPQERGAKLAAGKVYSATKATIERQAPTYAKVMKDYSVASEQITEIERALSLGNKAAADTSMRKLQSLMRNNVQTNYGNRLSLANQLEGQGGVELMPSLAGQAMSSWTPRSLAGQIGAGGVGLSALSGNMLPLAALPFQSPRLVGSMLYGAGRAAGATSRAGNALAQMPGVPPALIGNSTDELANALYRFGPVVAASPSGPR